MRDQVDEMEMPTRKGPAPLSVERLIAAVKQLSPAESCEFLRQLDEWRQNGGQNETDAELLALIDENSRLPGAEQQHFNRLRRKRQAEILTEPEQTELEKLWQRVEQMNVTRLKALTRLAQRRNTDVRALMRDLGLTENKGVF